MNKDEKDDTNIEFNVDDSTYLVKLGPKAPFGGFLSVHKLQKKTIK